MIKKINQTNKDVLKRNGYSKPIGDLITIKTGANAGTDWGRIGLISAKCVGFWLGATAIGLLLAGWIAKYLKSFKSATVFSCLAFGLLAFAIFLCFE